ncbi:hypothetical protein AX774_g5237 [Zancudomyces culisetae]|uniref:Uncharacterized protein n=1 Tax=Zancudomyces culisetae TaxID=1213189 RepID=A0A1R1PK17_ZANCU|nr:hypothetical protein AX774_g5237 [Zancudomyces culisetae]|eukprot:OMH81308.1 hypothetical protein AX774_g5237 [Zancudomyces culisetae]
MVPNTSGCATAPLVDIIVANYHPPPSQLSGKGTPVQIECGTVLALLRCYYLRPVHLQLALVFVVRDVCFHQQSLVMYFL